MKIINKWIESQSGEEANAIYEDVDDFSHLPYEECSQVACFAFYKGKLLVVRNENKKKNQWGPVSGSIEKGELFEECTRRELVEEANVKMLDFKPIGYQEAWLPNKPAEYQLRVYCEVEPIGEFVEDPDGDIVEIKWIDPEDYKKYFDWGKVSDRILERALNSN